MGVLVKQGADWEYRCLVDIAAIKKCRLNVQTALGKTV